MRKIINITFVGLLALTALCVGVFKVHTIDETGFVGPDILWESNSFFSVYGQEEGDFLVNVDIDANYICPGIVTIFCTEVGDLTYFGDRPQIGDTVRVREYFFRYRWEDPEERSPIGNLTFVDILPSAKHADAVPINWEITFIFNSPNTQTKGVIK